MEVGNARLSRVRGVILRIYAEKKGGYASRDSYQGKKDRQIEKAKLLLGPA
jgi:hypothetical protein